jgi:hypothetical protein
MPFQPGTPVTSTEAATNWTSGSQAKAQKWVTNTLRPRVIFTQAAIANAQGWYNAVTTAGVTAYTAGMQRANNNLNQIANNIQQYGAQSYTSGVTAKAYKYAQAAVGLIPAIQQIVQSLPPRGGQQANIQRAVTFMQEMGRLRGLYRG